jgi:biotin carboxylase
VNGVNGAAKPCVLFVNLRRIPREGFASLVAARRLGYDVVLLGNRLPGFAAPLVKEFAEVDTYDHERAVAAAERLAARHPLAGVANFTEIDLQLVATVAERLGFPAVPVEGALRARNKYLMKDALAGLDGVAPRFARVCSLAELRRAVDDIGLPAVVKPTGASGSKGIFELREPRELAPAMEALARIGRPEFDPVFRQFGAEFIVEEFVAGDEVSVEGFVTGGKVAVVTVTDKTTVPPYHLEVQHVLPSALPAAALHEVVARTTDAVSALGFDDCAFHLEAKWGPGGFRFIEATCRPAGGYIASHLVPLATGIDYFENVIRLAVGEPLRLSADRWLHAGARFVLARRPGRFAGLDGLDQLLAAPGYEHVFFEVPVGARIALPPDNFGLQRVAAVCVRHPDRAAVDTLLDAVASDVTARIQTEDE